MRLTSITLIFLCLIMIAVPASATDKKAEKQMDPQEMMEAYKKLATPGEPHKQLASLAGSWTTKTKEWMEPGKPPMESTGSVEMKTLLDGRFLQQEFTGNMMGQPYCRHRDHRIRQPSQALCLDMDGLHGHRDLYDGGYGQPRRQDYHAERSTRRIGRRADVTPCDLEARGPEYSDL